MSDEWRIQVRNKARRRVAEVDDYGTLELVKRFRATGSWVLDVPWGSDAARAFGAGSGIFVSRNGAPFFSGSLRERERRWSGTEDTLVVSGVDDLVWLERRLALPQAPAITLIDNVADVRSGIASTVILAYVDVNAGPSAAVESFVSRPVPGLALAADPVAGDSVTGSGTFQTLAVLCDGLGFAGGELGYRLAQQDDDTLLFAVYVPTDKTADVVFSSELGNLLDFTYAERAPDATVHVTGYDGEGALRTYAYSAAGELDETWGTIEKFVDARDADTSEKRAQAVAEARAEVATQRSVAVTPAATQPLAFGTDYDLGDLVTFMLDDVPVQERVREAHVTLNSDGATVVPVIGSPGARDPRVPAVFRRTTPLARRVSHLERLA